MKHASVSIALILFSMIGSAIADDGQIDIASLPYTISSSGSYVVVADLTLTGADLNGITISASNVTIDLNGHTLTGPGKSSGSNDSGIFADTGNDNVAVFNGTIRDFPLMAVYLRGENSQVSEIRAFNNGGWGIRCEGNSTIRDNTCNDNQIGIHARGASVIRDNACVSNSQHGIDAVASTVTGNTCSSNGGTGIFIDGAPCTVTGNTCSDNDYNGIFTRSGSTLIGNTCMNNADSGIQATDSLVDQNSCTSNMGLNYNLITCTEGTNHQ